jgi:hypothetical protein
VTCILRQKNLHRFIDGYIERPSATAPCASRWMIISKYIRNWLCQGVSEEINRLVVSFRLRSHFADEYIEALKQTLRKPGHLAAFQDCVDLWTMRRNQHYTDLELVEAFLNQYAKVPQRVTISPFFLSQVVMNEIRYDNTRMAAARHELRQDLR